MASGDTKTNQYLDIAANGSRADLPTDTCCETRSQTLIREVAERIMDVEDEVERLENNPDVADIVATYADLQAYDTSQLTDKDVIRVLQDETHDGDSTYYRWSTGTNTWTYIGESKQYTDFVGTDGTAAGEAGLVPAPATTDAGKFLKADGTWDEAGGGTLYNTTGTNTDGAMTQKATTEMIYGDTTNLGQIHIGAGADPANTNSIAIGLSSRAGYGSYSGVAIGHTAGATGRDNVAIGDNAVAGSGSNQNYRTAVGTGTRASGNYATSLGYTANAGAANSTALGTYAQAGGQNAVAIGSGSNAGSAPQAAGAGSIAMGPSSVTTGINAIAMGRDSKAYGLNQISVGPHAGENTAGSISNSVCIGMYANVTRSGEVNIGGQGGGGNYGYNNTPYRLLGGVHDGVDAHDAVTVGQLNTAAPAFTNAEFNSIFNTDLEEES